MKNLLPIVFVVLASLASAQTENPAAQLVQDKDAMTDKVSSHYLIAAIDGTARLWVGCETVTLNLALPTATIDHLVHGGAAYTKGQMRLNDDKPSNIALLSTDQQHLTIARTIMGSWRNNDGKNIRLMLTGPQRVRFQVRGAGDFAFQLTGIDFAAVACPAK